jgi:hypothetical protein
MKRTIEILVAPNGELSIDAVGFHGADCEQATRFLETALGLASAKQRKPEYHRHRRQQRQQQLGS